MRSYYKYILMAFFCMTGVSCKKYLDVAPDNVGTLDYAFRNRNEAESYLFSCYSTMQQLNNVIYNAGFTTSAEIIYPNNLTANFFDQSGFNLIRGVQSTGSPVLNYWGGSVGNVNIFQGLRRCNTMLENIDKPIDLTEPEKKRWIAEVKFLKAFYHYYLIRMYGPVIIIDKSFPIDAPADSLKRKRSSIDESFAYVVSQLDAAIPDLPLTIENQTKEFGRITRFIAMSVKAEVLATAASPLFNGNPDYAGIKDRSGKSLFSASYDGTKWKAAADAAKAAITECEARGLHLNTTPPTTAVNSASDEVKQLLTLQSSVTGKWEQNPELIWALNYGFGYQGFVIPKLTSDAVSMANTYPSNWAVPIAEAELFYTKQGVPINEDKTFDYAGRFTPKAGDDANKHYIKQGYETAQVNLGREPRYYASLAFDGSVWFGNGKVNESDAPYVQARGIFATAGPKSSNSTNITGIWPKKLANYQTVMDKTFDVVNFQLPIIRLSGLYLLYAEALNEAEGPSAEVYKYIDMVRARAGLQGVQASWTAYSTNPGKAAGKDGLRQIIHQERRIELAFEGQIGWDLRRWKELQEVLSKPLQGWNINEGNSAAYYRPNTVLIPVFGVKDYLFPIATQDIIINENLVQNPYW
ncbi:RagB/SusD family nutrient uptake outer membrane protein [Mucilaginibacter sp. Mucisp84]|uniref:RagB/SusD family nutrient uptake outer membrane protein n=1 Tax=Mucilaginibacter sp. Mucisp84 TaxID=3243058 RepID=UPI0039A68E5A